MNNINNINRTDYLVGILSGLIATTCVTSMAFANQPYYDLSLEKNIPNYDLSLEKNIPSYFYNLCNDTINKTTPIEFKYDTTDISFEQEIQNISAILEKKIGSKIIDYWIPVDNSPKGSMLLIELENQEALEKKHDNLELELYLLLKDDLKKFKKIDFVALF